MIAELTPVEETRAGKELIEKGVQRGLERGLEQARIDGASGVMAAR